MLTAKHPFQCFKLLCLSWVCPAPLRKQQKWDRPPREHTPTFALGTIKIPPGLSGYVPRHWENSKSGTGQEIYPSLCSLHNYVSLYCLHILCCWVNSISGTESKCPTPGATHLRKQTKMPQRHHSSDTFSLGIQLATVYGVDKWLLTGYSEAQNRWCLLSRYDREVGVLSRI